MVIIIFIVILVKVMVAVKEKGKGKGDFYLTSVVPSVPTRLLSMETDSAVSLSSYHLSCCHW